MANESANPNISEIQTKNGSVYDIAAKRFSGNRTVELNGDVTANETGWDGSGKLEVSTTIAEGAVDEGKIADSAVTNAKVADGAVNWDKIASSVKNGTIAGNYTEKLATCAQVKTYVDEAITGHGSYLGQKSVAEVNALTDMNNGDHVSVSNAGSITNPDGSSTSVNAGDNVIYDGTLRKWDCLAGDYKVKQTAKEIENTDSTKTISKVTQNENGEVSFTYQTIGKVSSATTADDYNPTSGTIKTALDSKLDDSQLITSWSATASDSKIASEMLVKGELNKKAVDSDVVHKTGNENITGTKTFFDGVELKDSENRLGTYRSKLVFIHRGSGESVSGKYFVAKLYLCKGDNYNASNAGNITLKYSGNYANVNLHGLVKVRYDGNWNRSVETAWKDIAKKVIPSSKLFVETIDGVKYIYVLLVFENGAKSQEVSAVVEHQSPDSTLSEELKRFPYLASTSWMTLDEIKAVDSGFTLDALTTDWQDADDDLSKEFDDKLKLKNSINITGVTTQYVKIECGGNLREFLINAQGSMGALQGTILYRTYNGGTSARAFCTKLQGASSWSCYSETLGNNCSNLYIDLGSKSYLAIYVTSIADQSTIKVTCVDSIPSGLTALPWTPVPKADVSNTLAHARNLKVDLSSANAQSFDGSGNADSIGVSGKLADSNIASASTWNAKQDVIQSNLTQGVPVNVQGYFFIDCIDRHQTYIVKLEQNGSNSATFLYRSYWSGDGGFTKLTCLQSQNRDIVAYNEMYTPEGGSGNSAHRVYFKIPISASNSTWYFTITKVGNSSYDYMPTPKYTTELPEKATLIPCEYLQTEDNKVTSWSSTTSDKKYPSEKLVKDSLDLKANSSDVYTKTEVDSKHFLKAKILTASNNIDNYPEGCCDAWGNAGIYTYRADVSVVGGTFPSGVTGVCYIEVRSRSGRLLQHLYDPTGMSSSSIYYWERQYFNSWSSWNKVFSEATSTYSETGTQAVNGTAVASAIADKANFTKLSLTSSDTIFSIANGVSKRTYILSYNSTSEGASSSYLIRGYGEGGSRRIIVTLLQGGLSSTNTLSFKSYVPTSYTNKIYCKFSSGSIARDVTLTCLDGNDAPTLAVETEVPETAESINVVGSVLDGSGNKIVDTYATKTEVSSKANDSDVVHKTGNEVINDLKTFKKTIQINTDGTDDSAGVNLSSKSGQINFVSGSSKRGLYLVAHGTGSAGWALEIDTNNVVKLNGKATSVTKELTASDIDALWAE